MTSNQRVSDIVSIHAGHRTVAQCVDIPNASRSPDAWTPFFVALLPRGVEIHAAAKSATAASEIGLPGRASSGSAHSVRVLGFIRQHLQHRDTGAFQEDGWSHMLGAAACSVLDRDTKPTIPARQASGARVHGRRALDARVGLRWHEPAAASPTCTYRGRIPSVDQLEVDQLASPSTCSKQQIA